ncbi:MAG: glycosyltransferase family 4 protein [Chloroflexi bacterium]|nr:glycosyltransferase family 4 protein [Chloroflexota bacterium]
MATPRFFPETGGVENHVYQVARRLAAQGQHVEVLTTDRSRKLPLEESLDGFQIKRVPAWPRNSDFYFAPAISREVIKGDWDILHVQSYHTFVPIFAMWAAVRAGKSFVLTFHGGGHSSHLRHAARTFQRVLLRPLIVRASKLIAIARFEIDLFSRELNLPREQFALIPNGAELPPIKRQPGNRSSKETLIASVGRLERYKGHQRVIAAMPYVLKQKPDVRLWIAGSGPYEAELRGLSRKLNVQDKVEIRAVAPDAREKFAEELSKASLFVLFSEYETHPLAALEAISLGCPALVSDTSGLREISEDGLAKSLPLNCTDEQLAQAMIEQLDRPMRPRKIKLPTWDDCANNLLVLYRDVLKAA